MENPIDNEFRKINDPVYIALMFIALGIIIGCICLLIIFFINDSEAIKNGSMFAAPLFYTIIPGQKRREAIKAAKKAAAKRIATDRDGVFLKCAICQKPINERRYRKLGITDFNITCEEHNYAKHILNIRLFLNMARHKKMAKGFKNLKLKWL